MARFSPQYLQDLTQLASYMFQSKRGLLLLGPGIGKLPACSAFTSATASFAGARASQRFTGLCRVMADSTGSAKPTPEPIPSQVDLPCQAPDPLRPLPPAVLFPSSPQDTGAVPCRSHD